MNSVLKYFYKFARMIDRLYWMLCTNSWQVEASDIKRASGTPGTNWQFNHAFWAYDHTDRDFACIYYI